MGFYSNGVGWVSIFLADTQSRLYPHMRAKFERDPTAVSKKVPFRFISRYQGIRREFQGNTILEISSKGVQSIIILGKDYKEKHKLNSKQISNSTC